MRSDAITAQEIAAEAPRRTVNVVRHKEFVARFQNGQQASRDRGKTCRIKCGPCGARLKLCQRLGKRPLSGGPLERVTIFAEPWSTAFEIFNPVEEDR